MYQYREIQCYSNLYNNDSIVSYDVILQKIKKLESNCVLLLYPLIKKFLF